MSRLNGSEQRAVKKLLTSTQGLNTAYSGIGFFEAVIMALSAYMGIKMPKCTHAFEIDVKARIALLSSEKDDTPAHVFGDICGVFPSKVVRKMKKLQRRLALEHKRMVACGEAPCALTLAFSSIVHGCRM